MKEAKRDPSAELGTRNWYRTVLYVYDVRTQTYVRLQFTVTAHYFGTGTVPFPFRFHSIGMVSCDFCVVWSVVLWLVVVVVTGD